MPNFYTFDIIKNPEGEYKIVDAHGSFGGSLAGFQMAGGMPEARARTTKYLEALNRLSNGKLILYCVMGHVAHSPFLPSAVLEYLTVYPELTPVLKWTEDMQARLKRIKRGRAHPISLAGDGDYIDKVLNSRDDIALLYFYNRPDKIGNLNSRRGRITLNYVRKKQSEDWQHEQKINSFFSALRVCPGWVE